MVLRCNNFKTPKILLTIVGLFILSIGVGTISFYNAKTAQAHHICCNCGATCIPYITVCAQGQCVCQSNIETPITIKHITDEFIQHREWLIKIAWEAHLLPAMMLMSEQISTLAIHQVLAVGTFFDAKHQLESQRLLQELQADIHKKYQPSKEMCEFGTNMRSMAASERKADVTQIALSTRSVQRQLLSGDSMSAGNSEGDLRSRLDQLETKYCNPDDMGGDFNVFCQGGDKAIYNSDIDYTTRVDTPKTLKLDFTDTQVTPDEEAILALSANLYGHHTMPRIPENIMASEDGTVNPLGAYAYMDIRALAAKRSVAQASYAAQVAMRTQGEEGSKPYMEAILKEMGVEQEHIDKMIQEKPSYHLQMELLTKKLYQNPKFYSNLYDTPFNVDRQNAAMNAIALMQRRDMYRSALRSEAIAAVWLESKLKLKEDLYSNEAGPFRQGSEILKLE